MCSIIYNTAEIPEPVPYCWGETCSIENENLCTNENFNSDCIVQEVDAQNWKCFAPGCDEDWECVTNYCEIDPTYEFGVKYPVEGNGSTKSGICKDCTQTPFVCAGGEEGDMVCQLNGGPYNGVCREKCTPDNGVCSSWETCDTTENVCVQNPC